MYAESLFFPYVQQFDDFCLSNKSNLCLSSTVSDYDLGGEGDLFKAPEPIIEQPWVTPQELSVTDIESFHSDELLCDVFHEYAEISPLSEVLNCKFAVKTDDSVAVKEDVHSNGQISKSVSSDCLSSIEWIQGAQIKPGFFNVSEGEFEFVYGMRRACSEGDIKTLANGNGSHRHSSLMSEHTMEDRWQKLSRYRDKKTKRNFGRKIKYACRKALADSQPRIRGRFARTEESEILRN